MLWLASKCKKKQKNKNNNILFLCLGSRLHFPYVLIYLPGTDRAEPSTITHQDNAKFLFCFAKVCTMAFFLLPGWWTYLSVRWLKWNTNTSGAGKWFGYPGSHAAPNAPPGGLRSESFTWYSSYGSFSLFSLECHQTISWRWVASRAPDI